MALSADRNTPARSGDIREFPVAASTTIYGGGMVAINASGWAVPAATSTTLKVVGRAEKKVANTGANGALTVKVATGVFRFKNSTAADAINRDDIGLPCYAVDDEQVALTNGSSTRSVAGTIFDVDADGVWVKF
jgi:hypothetical protein